MIKLWNQINTQLINFVNSKINDLNYSKDLVQDVFIIVSSKIDTLRDKDKVVPWIYQITRNQINNYFRKHQYNNPDIEYKSEEQVMDSNLTQEFSRCILPMIEQLPDKYQEAIRLIEIEGLSQKELARRIGVSYSGTKSRVQRGRELLKSMLLQCCRISTDKYGNVLKYNQKNCPKDCD